MSDEKKTGFSWVMPEYEKHAKRPAWFIAAAILGAALLAYSIFAKSWTFTVLIVVFAAVYVIGHMRRPREVTIDISGAGIKFGQKFYPYEQLKNFWFAKLEGAITIHTKSKLVPQMTISLKSQNAEDVRAFLKEHISELPEPEPTMKEHIYKTLGI